MRRCYVAGPIGANDDGRAARIVAGIHAGAQLLQAGFEPFVPHLWAAAHPFADDLRDYEGWMAYCFAWLDACDLLVRIPGHSPGADREVARATERGIPVMTLEEALAMQEAA